MKKPSGWFMDIRDKIFIANNFLFKDKVNLMKKYCPPHYIPHTIPFIGKKIIKEPCHFHENRLRMLHHIPFCYLWCPHYEFMMEKYKKHRK
jgi:hypothetical protein